VQQATVRARIERARLAARELWIDRLPGMQPGVARPDCREGSFDGLQRAQASFSSFCSDRIRKAIFCSGNRRGNSV
jgi:hypothetical protein